MCACPAYATVRADVQNDTPSQAVRCTWVSHAYVNHMGRVLPYPAADQAANAPVPLVRQRPYYQLEHASPSCWNVNLRQSLVWPIHQTPQTAGPMSPAGAWWFGSRIMVSSGHYRNGIGSTYQLVTGFGKQTREFWSPNKHLQTGWYACFDLVFWHFACNGLKSM